jgi:hypothetical protein
MKTKTELLNKVAGLLNQIQGHASLENQDIANGDAGFGVDELRACRIKANMAVNALLQALELSEIIELTPSIK